MKILMLAQYLTARDGWGTSAGNTAMGLAARGHDVLVLVQTVDPSVPCRQIAVLPPPLPLLDHPLTWWKTARATAKAIRDFRPDIVHVLTEPYVLGIATLSLWRRELPPLAMTACGTYAVLPLDRWKTRWMMRRAYARLSHVFAISRYTQQRVLEQLHKQNPAFAERVAAKTDVWTLGIVPPSSSSSHKNEKKNAGEKRILFVGGIKWRKGIHDIIEACARLRDMTQIPFRLDLIGSNPQNSYQETLTKRVRELGLERQVIFRGHVTDTELIQAYAEADLFVMLSGTHGHYFEGFGLVFLEANALGIPVIGPKNSGCEDAIADGRSGFLVDPKNPDEAAERMRWILEEGRIRPEECRAWVAEHSIDRQAGEAEEAYRQMLSAKAS